MTKNNFANNKIDCYFKITQSFWIIFRTDNENGEMKISAPDVVIFAEKSV